MRKKRNKVLYCTGSSADRPLVYVLRGEKGDLLIDTGNKDVVHEIDDWIKENNFNIKWVFITHGHFDHTWNTRFFKSKYGAEVIMHENDRDLFCMMEENELIATDVEHEQVTETVNKLTKINIAPFCKVDHFLTDNDTDFLRKLGFDADVIMLPGHTMGSIGILSDRVLYSGDAISAKQGDYYVAMFGEDIGILIESDKKIFDLNPLVIAPGHGKLVINEYAFGKSLDEK